MTRDPHSVYLQFNITHGDQQRGIRVRDDLRSVIQRMGFYDVQAELTGSCATGIGLRGADVDITLLTTNRQFTLDQLAEVISRSGSFRLIAHIKSAKVPILDLRHQLSGSPVDVCLNKPNGLTMSRLLRAYADRNPLLEPMIVYVKWWAQESRLINSKNHYFSGFLFALMVIFHQQQRNGMAAVTLPRINCSEAEIRSLVNSQPPCTKAFNQQSLKQEVFDFFQFYADFDYKRVINIREKGRFIRTSTTTAGAFQYQYPIDIIDPDPHSNENCASHVHQEQLDEAKGKFRIAANDLRP